jgi:hypothetical protein
MVGIKLPLAVTSCNLVILSYIMINNLILTHINIPFTNLLNLNTQRHSL